MGSHNFVFTVLESEYAQSFTRYIDTPRYRYPMYRVHDEYRYTRGHLPNTLQVSDGRLPLNKTHMFPLARAIFSHLQEPIVMIVLSLAAHETRYIYTPRYRYTLSIILTINVKINKNYIN